MRTVVITGGAGFIGSHLARLALRRGFERVVVIDNLTYAGSLANLEDLEGQSRFRFERGDIRDRDTVRDLFRRHRPAAVLNLAAESHVDRSIDDPRPFIETNLVGTFELLEAARLWWRDSDPHERADFRLLHVSTDEVFGSIGGDESFREDTRYDPSSPYSASKAGADHLVRAYQRTYGLPTLITNCSNNYGPYQLPEKLLPLMILNALEGRDLPIYGDGSNVRDWIYVADHCDGLLAVLERGAAGETYNLGARNEATNLDLVGRLCDLLDAAVPAAENTALRARGLGSYHDLKTFVPDRPGHDQRYAIDPAKAERELHWRASTPLEEGLRRTVSWYVEHRDWCHRVQSGQPLRLRRGLG